MRCPRSWPALVALVTACAPAQPGDADGTDSAAGDSVPADSDPPLDLDQDGLADAAEAELAARYLPFLSLHPDDGCPRDGLVYRMRPHPLNASKLHIVYVHLFEYDCGAGGHPGDNETFSMTVDPSLPPGQGVEAIKTIAHQGTPCQQVSTCGRCSGLAACTTRDVAGEALPVVYTGKDKHGTFLDQTQCIVGVCLDYCAQAPAPRQPPFVNAGEPWAHLVEDLTTEGFITTDNGWSEPTVMNYDPWDPQAEFGTAGNVYGDLIDPAFDTPVCP